MPKSLSSLLQPSASNEVDNDEEQINQILDRIGGNNPEIQNTVQTEMDEYHISKINQTLSTVKSKNTKKAYVAPIKSYTSWSNNKYGNNLVDGKKLLLWLNDVVFKMRIKNEKMISYSTVKVYISVICDLHARQKANFQNSSPNPRTASIRLACNWYLKELAKEKKENYVDRGIGTKEGYDMTELIRFSIISFNKKNALKYRLAQFLCHFLLLRGDNVRKAELADLDVITFAGGSHIGASVSGIQLLVLIIRESKTNTNNRLQYSAVARNKDYRICTIGALAVYFFDQIYTSEKPIPFFDLSSNKSWFDLKIIPNAANPKNEMLYETHVKGIKSLFNEAGINPGKWTHSGRGSGARLAELNGAQADSIRRLGHWNDSDSMTSSYLLNLPMDVIKVMAGFSPGQDYHITRAGVAPPIELQVLIWPEIEEYELKLQRKEVEVSIALKSFLNVMKFLRIVFLQDSIFLKHDFPENRIFSHSIFNHPLYYQFRNDMLSHLEIQVPLEEENIISSIPTLKEKVNQIYTQLVERDRRMINIQNENITTLNQLVQGKLVPIEDEIKKIGEKIDNMVPTLKEKERFLLMEQKRSCALSLLEAAKETLVSDDNTSDNLTDTPNSFVNDNSQTNINTNHEG